MKTRAARHGIKLRPKQNTEDEELLRQKLAEIRLFRESPVWKNTVKSLRDEYLRRLLNCAPADDLERFRLQTALNVVDKVEKHIEMAHSGAELDIAKVVKADFAQRRAIFWR